MGVRPGALSRYHTTKWQAEEYVRHSGLDWTIFRPSLIHGPEGELMQMEAKWARYSAPPPVFFMPFMPYFGGRRAGLLQPVYVKDVARAFVDGGLEDRGGRLDIGLEPADHGAIAAAKGNLGRGTPGDLAVFSNVLLGFVDERFAGFDDALLVVSAVNSVDTSLQVSITDATAPHAAGRTPAAFTARIAVPRLGRHSLRERVLTLN